MSLKIIALRRSFFWVLVVLFLTMIPILCSYITDSLDISKNFLIINHIANGTIIIVALGIASAAWVDNAFSKDKENNMWIHLALVIILFITTACIIELSSLEESKVNMEFLAIISWLVFASSLIYSWIIKYVLFSR